MSFTTRCHMQLIKFLRKLKKRFIRYEPSVEVIISKEKLVSNLKEYQKQYPKLSFAPVLKSNAYGHGLVPVAKILEKENIAFFVVDSLYEAMVLRSEGIKSEVLIIGYVNSENIRNAKLSGIVFTVISLEQLQEIAKVKLPKLRIHLKIDTGMHRQGILLNQIEEAIKIIKTNTFIELKGICSHFADADSSGEMFTKLQIQQWEKAVNLFKNNFQTIKYYHLTNTAGIFYSHQAYCNVARLGIGLYGINTSSFVKLNLKPVLEIQSVISSIKVVPVGECVGYNATYKADKPIKVANVPVGFFEGVDIRLSSCGYFKVGGVDCPIVGRVSMNITSIDITSLPSVKLGDKVTVISSDSNDNNSVENIVRLTQTIPYEILVHIPQHLRRTVV